MPEIKPANKNKTLTEECLKLLKKLGVSKFLNETKVMILQGTKIVCGLILKPKIVIKAIKNHLILWRFCKKSHTYSHSTVIGNTMPKTSE